MNNFSTLFSVLLFRQRKYKKFTHLAHNIYQTSFTIMLKQWNMSNSDKVFWHFSINFKIRFVACHAEENCTERNLYSETKDQCTYSHIS